MNTPSNAISDPIEAQRVATATLSPTRPMYWSVRRELWENRWILIGQLIIAGMFFLGFLITTIHLPAKIRALSTVDATQYWVAVSLPYNIAAGAMMAALILMSLFYSADALHGERRDRSILFWKSLPVSDATTVLAKAAVPLIALPLLTFGVTVALQFIMLLWSSVVLAASGLNVGALWRALSLSRMWWDLLYHLFTAHALWPFPIFCWLILVSGWTRRASLLWAALPVVVIGGIEKLAFNTSYFATMVGNRLIGAGAPIDHTPGDMFPLGPMTHLTPFRYLAAPGLWIGLACAALFLAGAIRSRHYRGTI